MNAEQHRAYQALLRIDFEAFAHRCFLQLNPGVNFTPGWHVELVAAWMALLREQSSRMIINLPPRHLKSLLGSIALPAWLLGHNPSLQIICASYGAELAHKLSRDCRTIMESGWYKDLFPGTRLDRYAVNELTTTKHGVRMATSVDGVLTGRGADLIIIDDPLKPDEALSDATRVKVNGWYDTTVFSRLNNKQEGSVLLIMQRLHEDDLTGHLASRPGWDHLVLPAIAEKDFGGFIETSLGQRWVGYKKGEALHPARESVETLETIRQTIGEYNFAGQYQQVPAPREGGLVKRAWFQHYLPTERPERFNTVLQSWDTANKPSELSDYSVCTTWGLTRNRSYLLHVLRKKLDYPNLKRTVREQAALHNANVVLIEDKASGTQLIQELTQEGMYSITRYTPDAGMNKLMRLHAQTGAIENGLVLMPSAADWLDCYLHEMTTFPAAKHDDQVNSTSQALHWIKTRNQTPGIILYYERLLEEQRKEVV